MLYVLWGRFQNCKDLYHLLHLRTNGKSEYDAKSSKVSAWHRNLIKRLHLWIIIWDDYLVVYPPPPLLYGIIIHYYVNYNYYMGWCYNYIIIIHCLGIYPLPLLCDWFSCTILLLQKNADIGVNIVTVPPTPKSPTKEESLETTEKKKEKPAWLWKPLRAVEKNAVTQTYSLFQVLKCFILICCLWGE